MLHLPGYTPFEVRRLTIKNYQEVVNLITTHYSEDHEKDMFGDIENMDEYNAVRVKMKLQQNWSLGVFDTRTNQLVGVSMFTIQRKRLDPIEEDFEKFGFHENSKLHQIDQFFQTLEADVFEMLKVHKIFYSGMGTVDAKYRRLGLTHLAGAAAQKLAWESGCKYIVGCPTTEFLCDLMKKEGWTVLREIKYRDYDVITDKNLFKTAKYPNVKAQLAYKKIVPPNNLMPVAKF